MSTPLALVTKFGLFSPKIGHNSACTNTTAAEFASNRGFSGTADLMVPFNFPWADPCCHGNKIGLFSHKIVHNSAYTNTIAAEYEVSDTANLMWYINFSFVHL